MEINQMEKMAYIIMSFGVFLDHLTTGIALSNPNFYESNAIAEKLISKGLWSSVDIIMMLIIIISTTIIMRKLPYNMKHSILMMPVCVGIIRLMAGISNILLILGL